ncbi:hypothetical protein AXF42_Ash000599 [Apostasia shenzhenica]|uniref:Uncharacterized protein n=1 Tax=Apostasia shenzhenica TaxID=1088818 RepID=A0A2I0AGU7_9ASPA|nr:hypothetical protein AXF42_Ash000599 [Apostasia shenzhenica]
MPLVICGPAPLGEPVLLPAKTKKPLFPHLLPAGLWNEEKDKEEEGNKMEEAIKEKNEAPQVASEAALGIEGPGGKTEEGIKEEGIPPVTHNVTLDIEGTWGVLGKSLLKIRGEWGKILKNTNQIMEVVKNLKGKEEGEARFLQRIARGCFVAGHKALSR